MDDCKLFWLLIELPLLMLHGAALSERICPLPLYQYKENCYLNCPNGTTPYNKNRTCIDHCLNMDCAFFNLRRSRQNFNVYCPPQMCKPPHDKCFELQCFKSCPPETVEHEHVCLRSCPTYAHLKLNNTCVDVCPNYMPYIESSNCVSVCSQQRYLFGNICRESCPAGYHVFNGTCEKECPADYQFHFKSKSETFCLNKCPADTAINGTECNIQCPRQTPIHFNQTCIDYCPDNSKYIVEKTNAHAIVKCIEHCPLNLLTEAERCLERCSPDKMLFDNSCLDDCPQSHPYQRVTLNYPTSAKANILCLDKCPVKSRVLNNSCYDACPEHTFNNNGICVNECPDSHPFRQKTYGNWYRQSEISCVSQCSTFYKFTHGQNCVQNCQSPLFIMNSTCVENCSGHFPFYQKKLPDTQKPGCLQACSGDMVAYRHECLKMCPTNASFLHNGVCVKSCPFTHKFVDIRNRNDCVSVCPHKTVVFGQLCLLECPDNSSYIFNNTCLAKCPDSHPLVDIENRNSCLSECNDLYYQSMCLTKCPEGMLKYNKNCTEICPEEQPYSDVENKRCVIECPHIQHNGSCLNKCPNNTYQHIKECVALCPGESRFVIKSERYSFQVYNRWRVITKWRWRDVQPKCAAICPSLYFVLRNHCLPFCPKGYNFTFRQHCLKQCQPSYLYISIKIDTVSPVSTIYKCVPECPRNMVYEKRVCKNRCSSSSKFVVYNKCYRNCPASRQLHFKYRDDNSNSIKYICLSHCPEHSYRINNTCVLYCPPEMFGFNGNCVQQCPYNHALNYSKVTGKNKAYFCERECPVDTFQMDRNCFDICPNKTFHFNKTCVAKCPNSHKFHQQVIAKNNHKSIICKDRCPKFSVYNDCVNSCPLNRTFIHDNQCKPQCPISYPFAVTTGSRYCNDTCPHGTLSFKGKDCIKTCPITFVIYNKTCQVKCPFKYNFFETTSQGTLCRDKCYNGFVLSETECVAKCPATTYNVQGVCRNISKCPEKYPFEENRQQGRTCTDKCLDRNVLDGKYCESGCPYGYVIFNRKCVKHCPVSAPNELHKSALHFTYQVYCYDTCPSGYVSEKKACIKEEKCYNSGKITDKSKCTANCSIYHHVVEDTLKRQRFCAVKCPSGYVFDDKKCIAEQDCLKSKKYILNGKCIKYCKFRYYKESDYLKKTILCGEKCPKEHVLSENGICIKEYDCRYSGKYIYNDTCTSQCPPGHFISTDSLYKKCILSCPDNFQNGTHCLNCITPFILYNGACLKTCPTFTLNSPSRTCQSATPTVIVLFISIGISVSCGILFLYCFVYNCADKRELEKHFPQIERTYDEEETCVLKIVTSDDDTTSSTSPCTNGGSSIECVPDRNFDNSAEIQSDKRLYTQCNDKDTQAFLDDTCVTAEAEDCLQDTNEHLDVKILKTHNSNLHENTNIKTTGENINVVLDRSFYQIHNDQTESLNSDNHDDSIDSITELKQTFKTTESRTNFDTLTAESNEPDKWKLENINDGLRELQNKSDSETVNLHIFSEDDNVSTKLHTSKETEN